MLWFHSSDFEADVGLGAGADHIAADAERNQR